MPDLYAHGMPPVGKIRKKEADRSRARAKVVNQSRSYAGKRQQLKTFDPIPNPCRCDRPMLEQQGRDVICCKCGRAP